VGEIVGIHYDSDYYKDGISPDMLLYIGNDMYTHAEGTLVKFGRERSTRCFERNEWREKDLKKMQNVI